MEKPKARFKIGTKDHPLKILIARARFMMERARGSKFALFQEFEPARATLETPHCSEIDSGEFQHFLQVAIPDFALRSQILMHLLASAACAVTRQVFMRMPRSSARSVQKQSLPLACLGLTLRGSCELRWLSKLGQSSPILAKCVARQRARAQLIAAASLRQRRQRPDAVRTRNSALFKKKIGPIMFQTTSITLKSLGWWEADPQSFCLDLGNSNLQAT
jgi:hypothetical protein